jgi:predicted metal-dependent hydrolase
MSNKEVLVRDMVIGRQDNKRKEQRDAETSEKKKKHHERIARGSQKKHAKITREAATRQGPGTSVRWGSARVAGVYFALNLFRRALYTHHD